MCFMTISDKLVKRLRHEFPDEMEDIPEGTKPYRLYHGHWQRSIGSWSWGIGGRGNIIRCIGSQWSMKDILKEPKIVLFTEFSGELSVCPAN